MSNNKIKTLNKRELLFKNKLKAIYNKNKFYSVRENKYLFKNNNKGYIKSAVLCLLEPNSSEDNYNILLTERSKELRIHAGQISFPGGKLDKIDQNNYINCAYREANEEIGFEQHGSIYLGKLNKFITGTGYVIQPIIALSSEKQKYKLNSNEVTSILHFPINYLKLKKNTEKIFFDNKKNYYYNISWNAIKIWGATAIILINLFTIIRKC